MTSGIARPERVRAGDDQHRDGALDRGRRCRRATIHTTNVTTAGAARDVEQQRRRAVGERLRPDATPAPRRRVAGCRRARCRRRPQSTRTRIAESVATVPATTRSPTPSATGRDSPVIIDSSSSAAPVDDLAVGRHARAGAHEHDVARRAARDAGTVSDPSRRVDEFGLVGQQRRRARRARPAAWPIARISCQWPSSMIAISAASSHQKSRSTAPNSSPSSTRTRP